MTFLCLRRYSTVHGTSRGLRFKAEPRWHAFVRQYREEKELTAWLLVDLSPSMQFGTVRRFKRDLAVEFAGVAAYIITRHGDKVGGLVFPTQAGVSFIPPRAGRQHAHVPWAGRLTASPSIAGLSRHRHLLTTGCPIRLGPDLIHAGGKAARE